MTNRVERFIIEANKGSIRNVLNELEEDYLYSIKNIAQDKKENIIKPEFENINNYFNVKNLKYYNEYGGFSEDGTEYHIRIHKDQKLPTVWSHLLTNQNFLSVAFSFHQVKVQTSLSKLYILLTGLTQLHDHALFQNELPYHSLMHGRLLSWLY